MGWIVGIIFLLVAIGKGNWPFMAGFMIGLLLLGG